MPAKRPQPRSEPASDRQRAGAAALVGLTALVGMVAWIGGWTGDARPWNEQLISIAALTGGLLPIAGAWIVAAGGWGYLARRIFGGLPGLGLSGQIGLGIAIQLIVLAALGHLGALPWRGGLVSWAVLGVGALVLLEQGRRHAPTIRAMLSRPPDALIWTAVPAVAVWLIAACSAPGWLWATEFGGYDALSYHLQLPREWLAAGAVAPLEHNVYSHMPGYVEIAYVHLMTLIGDAYNAAYACQMLHGLFGLVAACQVARLVRVLAPDHVAAQITAAVVLIGTPWVIVTGSLAYNELAVVAMLGTGLLVIFAGGELSPIRRGLLIGTIAAAACGAKLTAIGFVAAPLGLLLVLTVGLTRWRQWANALQAAALAGAIGLSPWLVANTLASGNPVFPFAAEQLGTGHWTAEQAATWAEGHATDADLLERGAALWHQYLRFGVGDNPQPGEPWRPQWLILPWLMILAAGVLLAQRTEPAKRRAAATLVAVLGVQIVFWMGPTHLQSRFLLPTVVPAAALIGLAISLAAANGTAHGSRPRWLIVLACGLVLWTSANVWIFAGEADGAPAQRVGAVDALSGRGLNEEDLLELGRETYPHFYIRAVLDESDRVLLIGDAAPFYYPLDRIAYHTVWDRGPLSRAIEAHPQEPRQWMQTLRDEGFTHVLIDADMLRRWDASGWLDPNLRVGRLHAAFDNAAEVAHEYRQGRDVRLYRLPH